MMVGKKDEAQRQKFIKKARELECDEDEAVFEETLKQVAKTKPKKEAPDN